ncbi:MAG: histidine phosphatase family protein [Myxococcales bacterium]|nr:histidine phosphatase family protein [Myxococcales bacterium]
MTDPSRPDGEQLVVVLVGLPARGKSYVASKIGRFLRWLGWTTRVFNVGAYRRARLGAHHRESFFAPDNAEGLRQREAMADAALEDLIQWMHAGGAVGIYDATNTTKRRRSRIRERLSQAGLHMLFIESICEDPALVLANIRQTKLRSPDYAGVPVDEAVADFSKRVAHYERAYEPLGDGETSYVKFIDVGRRIEVEGVSGYLPSKILFFLMNTHLEGRPVWLTRHGESEFNVSGQIGGDAVLSESGRRYPAALAEFVRLRVGKGRTPVVFTSTLKRTRQTAGTMRTVAWRLLNEIDAGICDGMTYDEIRTTFPDEFAARQADKLRYRYPSGESYVDVIGRLEPVLVEIERQRQPVLVVAHQAVIRLLYGYFKGVERHECPHLEIPLHTVIELRVGPYGLDEERFCLIEPSTDD